MDTPVVTPWYLDKAFFAMFVTPIVGFLNAKFGLGLNAMELFAIAVPVGTFIAGHKWKTATLQKALIAADAASDSVVTPSDAAAVINKP